MAGQTVKYMEELYEEGVLAAKPGVRVTATTGKAAVAIGGETIYRAAGLPVQKEHEQDLRKGSAKLIAMQRRLEETSGKTERGGGIFER